MKKNILILILFVLVVGNSYAQYNEIIKIAEAYEQKGEYYKAIITYNAAIVTPDKTDEININERINSCGNKLNKLREKAEKARQDALKAKDEAEKAKNEAENAKNEALKAGRIALDALQKATEAEKAKRLILARYLSLQALNIFTTKDDQELPYTLIIQSYLAYLDYGDVYDYELFRALLIVSETQMILPVKNHEYGMVRNIAISKDDDFFVACRADGKIMYYKLEKLIDTLETIKIKDSIELKNSKNKRYNFRSIAISNDSKYIIAGTFHGNILIWNTTNLQEAEPIVLSEHNSIVNQIIFLPDSNKFFSASTDGTIRMWNIKDIEANIVKFWKNQNANNDSIIFKIDNKITATAINKARTLFAIASSNGNIKIINTSDFTEENIFIDTASSVNINIKITSLMWNNNDLYIGFETGNIEIWREGNEKDYFTAHSSAVNKIFFIENTKRLITCSNDNSIKIWDNENFEKEPMAIEQHNSLVYCMALTSDNKNLISGSVNNIIITTINITTLIKNIRSRVTENMSPEDWRKYIGNDKYSKELPEID